LRGSESGGGWRYEKKILLASERTQRGRGLQRITQIREFNIKNGNAWKNTLSDTIISFYGHKIAADFASGKSE